VRLFIGEIARLLFSQSLAGKSPGGEGDAWYLLSRIDELNVYPDGNIKEDIGIGTIHLAKPEWNVDTRYRLCGTFLTDNISATEKAIDLTNTNLPETILNEQQRAVAEGFPLLGDFMKIPVCAERRVVGIERWENVAGRISYHLGTGGGYKDFAQYRRNNLPSVNDIKEKYP